MSPVRNLSPKQSQRLRVFVKKVGRGINRFHMIQDGDRLLAGISGGKDSLALCLALKARLKWVPIRYELAALFIDWKEYPAGEEERAALEGFFGDLEIPLRRVCASIFPPHSEEPFSCYICSQNRKRLLFQEASRLGISKVLLGHNLDDMVQTTLLNLFFQGEFSTMMPVQDFFGGRIKILRPMCEVLESDVLRFARRFDLPVLSTRCPNKETNQRELLKEILRSLQRVDRRVRQNIYRAPWHINYQYLPIGKQPVKPR